MQNRKERQKTILTVGLKISDKNRVFSEFMKLSIKDNEDRRVGMDRRKFSYHAHIPDIRSGKERRNELAI